MRTRLTYIDSAKALGIVLVCLGHFLPGGSIPKVSIYAFHVPLFFLISGLLASASSATEARWTRKIKAIAARVLLPYSFWFALSFLSARLLPRLFRRLRIKTALECFLFLDGQTIWNEALWFLPSYFLVMACFHSIKDLVHGKKTILAAICVLCFICSSVFYMRDISLAFLGIDKGILMLGFVLLGYCAGNSIQKACEKAHLVIFAPVLWLLTLILSTYINQGDNISIMNVDYNNILFYIPAACILTVGFVIGCALLPRWRMFELLSRNTLFIMSSHYYILKLLRKLSDNRTLAQDWFYAGLTILLYVALLWILDRVKLSSKTRRRLGIMGFQL